MSSARRITARKGRVVSRRALTASATGERQRQHQTKTVFATMATADTVAGDSRARLPPVAAINMSPGLSRVFSCYRVTSATLLSSFLLLAIIASPVVDRIREIWRVEPSHWSLMKSLKTTSAIVTYPCVFMSGASFPQRTNLLVVILRRDVRSRRQRNLININIYIQQRNSEKKLAC